MGAHLFNYDLQETWEELHKNPRYQPRYPQEAVVRWALTKLKPNQKVIDIGCGAGRHTLFLAKEGFHVTATDISRIGIDITKKNLAEHRLDVDGRIAGLDNLDFESASFDGILAYGVLYYASFEEITKAFHEMYRILKPGGHLFIVTRSDQDWRANHGEWVAPSTYKLTRLQGTPAEAEQGMSQVFLTKFEVRELTQEFSHVSIDFMACSREDGQYVDHDWVITATK